MIMENPNHCEIFKLVFIISKYSRQIMQVLDVDIKPLYQTGMKDTKCLYTAVMLIYLLTGCKCLKLIKKCDVKYTIERNHNHSKGNVDSLILNTLRKRLFMKQSTSDTRLFYVLISDGHYENKTRNAFFPGHVMVIEHSGDQYFIYQSYIDKYTLNTSLGRTLSECKPIHNEELDSYIDLFSQIVDQNFTWKKTHISKWNSLTRVKPKHLLGLKNKNSTVHVCFKEIKVRKPPIQVVNRFIHRTLKKIEFHKSVGNNEIFKPENTSHMNQNEYFTLDELHNSFKQFQLDVQHFSNKKSI